MLDACQKTPGWRCRCSPLGTKLPITLDFEQASTWLLPFYHTFDYVNTIWFTTILGLFLPVRRSPLFGLVQKCLGGSGGGWALFQLIFIAIYKRPTASWP